MKEMAAIFYYFWAMLTEVFIDFNLTHQAQYANPYPPQAPYA